MQEDDCERARLCMQRVHPKLISGTESVLPRLNLHKGGCVPVPHNM